MIAPHNILMHVMEKPGRRRSEETAASNMDSFISCFSASSLIPSPPQSIAQPSVPSPPTLPIAAMDNTYAYLPGQYWHTLDYYDVSMGIGTDLAGATQISEAFLSTAINLSGITDSTPGVDSPLSGKPESIIDLDNELERPGTLSRTESVCSNHNTGGHHHHVPCDACERDKKERRKEQNRKAQRNHRLRSEAKVEQLRAKVQSQSQEIAALKEVNRLLQKDLENWQSKGGGVC